MVLRFLLCKNNTQNHKNLTLSLFKQLSFLEQGNCSIKKTICFYVCFFRHGIYQPFFGNPLPFPDRDRLSSNLPFGLVGTVAPLLRASLPLSLTESPLPESRDEFFLSRLFALALILASLMEDAEIQFPLISFFISSAPAFSSSPEKRESLKLSGSLRGK